MNVRRLLSPFPARHIRIAHTHSRFRSRIMTTPQSAATGSPLTFQAGPIVWIDCEMTGLDPRRDKLLEIAVIVTDGNLEAVDEGVEFVIRRDRSVLDTMDEWCIKQHRKSGLTQACLESPHSKDDVSSAVLAYIKRWIPEKRTAVLAGNSVHADRAFLIEEMPDVVDWLHYRIVDVSSIKELCRRWYPDYELPPKVINGAHRATEDIEASIRELSWYRENIFRTP